MARRKSEQKEVVNAIVDAELELRELVERIKGEGEAATVQVMAMVRRLLRLPGVLPKQMLRQVWRLAFLARYTRIAEQLRKQADRNLEREVKAIRKFGRPLTEIEAIVDEDVKERISEKALG